MNGDPLNSNGLEASIDKFGKCWIGQQCMVWSGVSEKGNLHYF